MKFSLPEKFALPKMPSGKMALPKGLQLNLRMGEAARYFSAGIFEKALMSLDKALLWVVGISWMVAIAVSFLAFMAVRGAADLKMKAETARALEATVPRISRVPLSKEQYEPLIARVKKQYPGLSYELTPKPSLRIVSSNGEEFGSWLNAIGYTDSLVPSVRWTMTFFCAGTECPGNGLMQADLIAETINISQPEGTVVPESAAASPAAAAPPPTH